MKVIAVIVTYGDRFKYLKKVLDSLIEEKVTKVLVIDNDSSEDSKRQLLFYKENYKEILDVHTNHSNLGSSGGYYKGIELACTYMDCDFLWLLDDDNKPEKGALSELKKNWENISCENKNTKLSLLSYRVDRPLFNEAVTTNNPELVLGKRNSFLGFHMSSIYEKLLKVFFRHNFNNEEDKSLVGDIAVAPYGGLFFNKELINVIGLPKREFYLYVDDHEWSYRIVKSGGSIKLVQSSRVIDVDTSWNVGHKRFSFQIISQSSSFRLYYNTRNRVCFEVDNLVTNRFVYILNTILYNILFFLSAKSNYHRKIFLRAQKDGRSNKLGLNESIKR